MDKAKLDRLRAAGWRSGDAADFLELTEEEAAFVELKLALSDYLRRLRRENSWTQSEVAQTERLFVSIRPWSRLQLATSSWLPPSPDRLPRTRLSSEPCLAPCILARLPCIHYEEHRPGGVSAPGRCSVTYGSDASVSAAPHRRQRQSPRGIDAMMRLYDALTHGDRHAHHDHYRRRPAR